MSVTYIDLRCDPLTGEQWAVLIAVIDDDSLSLGLTVLNQLRATLDLRCRIGDVTLFALGVESSCRARRRFLSKLARQRLTVQLDLAIDSVEILAT